MELEPLLCIILYHSDRYMEIIYLDNSVYVLMLQIMPSALNLVQPDSSRLQKVHVDHLLVKL